MTGQPELHRGDNPNTDTRHISELYSQPLAHRGLIEINLGRQSVV